MTDTADTLRQVRAAEVQAMTHPAKIRYLRSTGWHRVGNHWRRRAGERALPLAAAVTTQMLAEMEST